MNETLQGLPEPIIDEAYVARQLTLHAPLTDKVARYGLRTPAAPELADLTAELDRAVHLSSDKLARDELREKYFKWLAQLAEAKEHFRGE